MADTIKQVYYQDYKTAYSEDENKKASDFGYIIKTETYCVFLRELDLLEYALH